MPTKRAFVIMPFSPTVSEKNWTEVFEGVFFPALEECGYSCTRAETSRGSLIASIIEGLIDADLVLADVTDRNANVFYELGVRHALRRGTIIVSQGTDHVPSDLRGYWYLVYGLRPAEVTKFKADIKRIVATFEGERDRSDSPVSDYLDREMVSSSRQVNRDNVKKLGALLTELSGNRLALLHLSTHSPQALSLDCLGLLIQTLYVDVGPEVLKLCYELQYRLRLLQNNNGDERVLREAKQQTETLEQKIGEIRHRMTRGQFSEPTTISTMVWSPREAISVASEATPNDALFSEVVAPTDSWDSFACKAFVTCTQCKGQGTVPCTACGGLDRNCVSCAGTGTFNCPLCAASRR